MHQGNWRLLRFCQLMGRCSGSAHSRFSSFPELLIILFSLLPWHPLLGGQLTLIKALYWINDLQPPVSVSKPPIFSSFKYLHNKLLKPLIRDSLSKLSLHSISVEQLLPCLKIPPDHSWMKGFCLKDKYKALEFLTTPSTFPHPLNRYFFGSYISGYFQLLIHVCFL